MMAERKIVIYCSSSYEIDPEFIRSARELTRALCSLGYTLVSGGAIKGMMGAVADEIARCGGRHIGVLPHFMDEYRFPGLDKLIWTDTMDERKEQMRADTVAAIALPGGIGTLDELIGTLTLAKLGRYGGKIYALNVGGFYEPLKVLLDHFVSQDMLDTASRKLIAFPDTVDALVGDLN